MTIDSLKEAAKMAFDTVRDNKLRSGLTILGVTVGVVTVMFMVSIIQGLNRSFRRTTRIPWLKHNFHRQICTEFWQTPGTGRTNAERIIAG